VTRAILFVAAALANLAPLPPADTAPMMPVPTLDLLGRAARLYDVSRVVRTEHVEPSGR
jgi:hypothetical protein